MPYPNLGPASEPRSAMPGPIRQEPDRDDEDDAGPAVGMEVEQCDHCGEEKRVAWWYENGEAAICYDCHEAELLERDDMRATIQRLKRENAALARESDALADALDAVTHEWLEPFGDHGECASCREYADVDIHRTSRVVLVDLNGGTGPHSPGDR